MIRVLHVVNRMGYGGIEAFIMNLYRNIDRTKIQFDFAVHTKEKGEYDEEIKKLGGNIYYFCSRRSGFIKYYNDWKKFLKNNFSKYTTIHMHVSSLTTLLPIQCAKKYKIKNRIIHAHSTLQSGMLHKLLISINKKRVKKYATELLACSSEAGNYVFGKNKFELFHNGIDIQKYKFNNVVREKVRKELGIKDNELALVHVGRFDYAKNHNYIIDIFKHINNIDKQVKLFLVGDGELKNEIKRKVTELSLLENVIFLNKRQDVNEILQGMDAFVFPSNYEGLPIAMIEAQAAGLRVFASTNISTESKISDLVEFMSIENEPSEWAEKIINKRNILKNRVNMEEILVKKGYDIINSANDISVIYNN